MGGAVRSALVGSLLLVGTGASILAPSAQGVAGASTRATGASVVAQSALVVTSPTADGHTYRYGAIPRIEDAAAPSSNIGVLSTTQLVPHDSLSYAPAHVKHPSVEHSLGKDLTYGGGFTGQAAGQATGLVDAGVTTGQPKVYLVIWGSQWGTEGSTTAANGTALATFSGDPDGFAPAAQTFFAGLGTDGETWSTILTQYCDGVATGSRTCNSTSQDIPYPTAGTVLAGVWYDNAAPSPSSASGHQIAEEAEAAAVHFGNTTQAENRDTQYVIMSPTGTDPDGWNSPTTGYCAYHDDTHDSSLDGGAAAGPIVAFTNMPYVPDAGADCGAGSVTNPGTLDGATSGVSHEYAETLSDQFPENNPPGGWSNGGGEEIGDLCAYITGVGEPFVLPLATGSVVVQGLWSNAANNGTGGCVQSGSIVTFPPTVKLVSPGSATVGASLTVLGTNLGGATSVTVGGAPAAITSDTDTELVVTVPANAQSGAVEVTTSQGSAMSIKPFKLLPSITSFAPLSVARGAQVTLTGTGLASATKVAVGSAKETIISDSANQIVFVVSSRTSSGTVSVKVPNGVAVSTQTLIVN